MIIYKATNLINNKIYIGQTRHSLEKRKRGHIYRSIKNTKVPFLKAINKYGFENFKWEIIHICDSLDKLNELEIFYIKKYNSTNSLIGYNVSDGGKVYSHWKDKSLSKEHKDNIGKSLIGKIKHTEEAKHNISIKNKGRIKSKEECNAISIRQEGLSPWNKIDINMEFVFELRNNGKSWQYIADLLKIKKTTLAKRINVIRNGSQKKKRYYE